MRSSENHGLRGASALFWSDFCMKTMRVAHDLTGARRAVVFACCLLAASSALPAQAASDMKQILERLDRLERQNAELIEQVRDLKQQLSATRSPAPATETSAGGEETLSDKVAVQQARIDEQAQSKVEAGHKLPIRITGMALFNAFDYSHADSGLYYGTVPITAGRAEAGGTLS